MKDVFCPNCNDMVTYKITKKISKMTLRGEIFIVPQQYAKCQVCGDDVFPLETRDYNIKSIQKKFLNKNNKLIELIKYYRFNIKKEVSWKIN